MGKKAEEEIHNILTHAYRKGYSRIVLTGKSNQIVKKVKESVSTILLGFEVTDISDDSITIENISEPAEQKYDLILKKIFFLIEETHSLLSSGMEKKKLADFNEITQIKEQTDKYILFCRRLLFNESSGRNIFFDWEFLTFLNHIEHIYYYLYKYAKDSDKLQYDEIGKMVAEVKDYFALLKSSYYEKDFGKIEKINELKKKYQFGKCLEAIEKSRGDSAVVFSYLRELFRMIQIATSPILSEILEEKNKY